MPFYGDVIKALEVNQVLAGDMLANVAIVSDALESAGPSNTSLVEAAAAFATAVSKMPHLHYAAEKFQFTWMGEKSPNNRLCLARQDRVCPQGGYFTWWFH